MTPVGPRRHAAIALVGAIALMAGCGADAARRPSVLLISLDTVRADHTTLFGYPRPTTPEIARLAGEGVSFDLAYTMTSTTGPTHATLFTGKYAPSHGIRKNGLTLPELETTLAEHLQARGYRTGAVVSSFVMDRKFGYAQGFETYRDDFDGSTSSLATDVWEGHRVPGKAFDRPGAATTALAVEWLEATPLDAPFFLFVHYFDPHEPYGEIEGYTDRFAGADGASDVDLYDGEIAYVDAQVGALDAALARAGRRDDTVVVITTDHGQGFMDHGQPYHGTDVYEESVRGLLVFRWPQRIAAGRVLRGPVEQVDLLPTLLDLIQPGSHGSLPLPGRSLAAALQDDAPLPAEHPVFLYRQWYPRPADIRGSRVEGDQYGVRVGRWKYIHGEREGTELLFDLATDPQERRNRAADAPAERARLAALLAAWKAEQPRPLRAPARPSDSDREKLRALGYVE